jgi:hypothetical protein
VRNSLGRPPTLAFVGYGRSGKDTCADWLRENTSLVYEGGCSWTARAYMAGRLSEDEGKLVTPDEAYARRHEDRDKWYRYLNEYREGDPTRLVRDCLAHSHVVCGIRDREELLGAKAEGLVDLVIWVDRDVPVDTTVTYSIDDCDLVLRNRGSKAELYSRLSRMAAALGIPSYDS